MALADPQTVTVGTARVLARVTTSPTAAVYTSADGNYSMRVDQVITKNKTRRSVVSISRKKISTDPISDLKNEAAALLSLSFARPNVGFTEAELIELSGIFTWLTASTNANLIKVLGMES